MKYKNLEDLAEAFEWGELSKDNPLCLDNDSTRCYIDTGEEWETVFDGGDPNKLLREALTLLGIPWENA